MLTDIQLQYNYKVMYNSYVHGYDIGAFMEVHSLYLCELRCELSSECVCATYHQQRCFIKYACPSSELQIGTAEDITLVLKSYQTSKYIILDITLKIKWVTLMSYYNKLSLRHTFLLKSII